MLPREADFHIDDFRLDCGESLLRLRLHYRVIGELRRDSRGRASNAVLILHGTTGSGEQFLGDTFAGELFGAGQALDAARHFIILPDAIGHGRSSKPSDGRRMAFPAYGYRDMVRAQHQLLMAGLGVDHLKLVMGTSMGGMHSWLWGQMYPDFMDFLAPLASLPAEIGGRNRMMRRMIMDAIRSDRAWNSGDYADQPPGLTNAIHLLLMMTSAPVHWQRIAPTRERADAFLAGRIRELLGRLDANDMLYQFAASEDYDPAPGLSRVKAPLLAINSADDLVNPPELGIMEAAMAQVKRGKYVMLPISDESRGHGTHTLARLWKDHLAAFLRGE